jgi:hypothetical protein
MILSTPPFRSVTLLSLPQESVAADTGVGVGTTIRLVNSIRLKPTAIILEIFLLIGL